MKLTDHLQDKYHKTQRTGQTVSTYNTLTIFGVELYDNLVYLTNLIVDPYNGKNED